MKNNELKTKRKYFVRSRFYKTKKFNGFVVSFDCDVPQIMNNVFLLIEFKFLFVGCWIEFSYKNKNVIAEYKNLRGVPSPSYIPPAPIKPLKHDL